MTVYVVKIGPNARLLILLLRKKKVFLVKNTFQDIKDSFRQFVIYVIHVWGPKLIHIYYLVSIEFVATHDY